MAQDNNNKGPFSRGNILLSLIPIVLAVVIITAPEILILPLFIPLGIVWLFAALKDGANIH